MGLLDFLQFKKEVLPTVVQMDKEDQDIYDEIKEKVNSVHSEAINLNARRNIFKRYYEGDHAILYDPLRQGPNQSKEVKNFCKPTIDKFRDFFTADGVKIYVPPEKFSQNALRLTAPFEPEEIKAGFEDAFNNADIRQKLLDTVLYTDNDWDREVNELSFYLMLYGDAFLQSQIVDGTIRISAVNPWNMYVGWAGDDYREMEWNAYVAQRSLYDIKKQYNIVAPADGKYDDGRTTATDIPMGNVIHYEDFEKEIIIIHKQIVYKKEKKGKLKLLNRVHLATDRHPGSPNGDSKIAAVIGTQDYINELASIKKDLIRYAPNNLIIAEGLPSTFDPKRDLKSGSSLKLLRVPQGSRVYPLELAKPLFPIEQAEQQAVSDFRDISGMPSIAFGVVDASLATGIALTTSFAPTAQKLKTVARDIMPDLKRFFANIFKQMESMDKFAAAVIQGNYQVEVKFGKMTPRDESLNTTNVVNKVNAKVMSLYSAMKETDVDSPRDELLQIAHEQSDRALNPEKAVQMVGAQVQLEQLDLQKQQLELQKQQAQNAAVVGTRPPTQGGLPGPTPNVTAPGPSTPPMFNQGEFTGSQSIQGATQTGGGSPLPLS